MENLNEQNIEYEDEIVDVDLLLEAIEECEENIRKELEENE